MSSAREPDTETSSHGETFAEALAQLTPEQAEMFTRALEATLKRRRILIVGYLASIAVLILGLLVAIYVYGSREPGTFLGWVFLLPFAGVGVTLMICGRLARRGAPLAPSDASGPSSE